MHGRRKLGYPNSICVPFFSLNTGRNTPAITLMQNAILECLHVYGIAAGISVAIDVTIKLIALALARVSED